MHHLPLRSSLAVSFVWLLAACGGQSQSVDPQRQVGDVGGQTGSASVLNPPECVCDSARGAVLFHGLVIQREAGSLTVEVIEMLSFDINDPRHPTTGMHVQGSYRVGLPCTETRAAPEHEALTEGARVLVHYEAGSLDEQPTLSVVHWQPMLKLSECATLPSSELDVLLDYEACRARFLVEPIPEGPLSTLCEQSR